MLMGQKNTVREKRPDRYGIFLFPFALGVFLLPIDWIDGIGAFGEYAIMSSFYVFLPLVLFALLFLFTDRTKTPLPPEILWFAGLMSAAFILSTLVNLPDILHASLKGRPGISKFATSTVTFYFSIALTIVTAKLTQTKAFVQNAIMKPLRLALILFFIVGIIEIFARHSGAMHSLYLDLSRFFRSGYSENSFDDGRLRSISGEPASAAVFLAFALIWLHGMVRLPANGPLIKAGGYALMIATTIFFLLTFSRTAYVLLLGIALCRLAYPVLLKLPLPAAHRPFSMTAFILFCAGIGALFVLSQSDTIMQIVTQGNNVSNLSRYASNYTAFSLFASHPLFGVGPGQYAFAAKDAMPPWGWKSWEIVDWFTNPLRTWPPVFSLPARLASEFGLLGLLGWYVPLVELFRRLLYTVKAEYRRLQAVPALGSALLLGMVYALLQGIAQESFRFFELWIILGVVCAYVVTREPETHFTGQVPAPPPTPAPFVR